jgi:hypothetical protein
MKTLAFGHLKNLMEFTDSDRWKMFQDNPIQARCKNYLNTYLKYLSKIYSLKYTVSPVIIFYI